MGYQDSLQPPSDTTTETDLNADHPVLEGQDNNDGWNLNEDLSNYIYCQIPYEKSIDTNAYAFIDGKLTTQADSINNPVTNSRTSLPLSDATMGYFDITNPNELVLSQQGSNVTLQALNIDSLKDYQTLYTSSNSNLIRSCPVDLLSLTGKKQVVSVLLSDTQIGLDIHYFKDGEKVQWCPIDMVGHNMPYANNWAFDIAVDDTLPDGTITVVAMITKCNVEDELVVSGMQTNIVSFTIDVKKQSYSLTSNQQLVADSTKYLAQNMQQGICAGNAPFGDGGTTEKYIWISYLKENQIILESRVFYASTSYEPVGTTAYPLNNPNAPVPEGVADVSSILFKHGENFYFIYDSSLDSDSFSYTLITFQQMAPAPNLMKEHTLSIPAPQQGEAPGWSSWGSVISQGEFYFMMATLSGTSSASATSQKNTYQLTNGETPQVNLLQTENLTGWWTGRPMLLASSFTIVAGTPKVTQLDTDLQPIAILDAPPTSNLIQYTSGTISHAPSITYSFEQQQSSTKNAETKTDRSQSEELSVGIKALFSLGGSISKKITTTTDEAHKSESQMSQNTQIVASGQDMILFMGMTITLYEYPVTMNGKPAGYFLFVVPASDAHLIIDNGQTAYRKTSHQMGNLLSYPMVSPADIQQQLYSIEISITDSEDYTSSINYSNLETNSDSTTTTTTVNKSASASIQFPIIGSIAGSIGGKLEGTYTNTEITLTSFTIENSFKLEFDFKRLFPVDADKNFSIQPYFYIDEANLLRCSYQVDIPTGGTANPTYWETYYTKPDFGMVMPFHTDDFKTSSDYLLSFDIETTPSELQDNLEELTIAATVRNWSLVRGTNVVVEFYYGTEIQYNPPPSPDSPGLVKIGETTIPEIEPRGVQVATITWKNPVLIKGKELVPIYVMINPGNVIPEMTSDNNFAMIYYPLSSLEGSGIEGRLQNPEDL